MSKTTWIIFAALCIILLGGLVWVSQSNRLDVSKVDEWKITSSGTPKSGEPNLESDSDFDNGGIADHVLGNKDAKVIIIEYGDYECPGCGAFAPVMSQVSAKYGDSIAFVFRNFPLSSIHPNARAAAAAAESAGLQGKYWEMHDKLYDNQQNWENLNGKQRTDTFASYATTLGLDKDKFIAGLTSDQVIKKIDFDIALGDKVGVNATPTVFVNGKKADQSVKDGKLVTANNTDPLVWSSADTFENLMVNPALQKAGVAIPK